MGRQPNIGTPIAFGLILAALVVGFFNYSTSSREAAASRTIQVKGRASKAIEADRAVWTGRTVNESGSLARVQQMLQQDRKVLEQFVKEQGFDSTRILFHPAQLERDPSGPGTRYTLVQGFRLEGEELDRIRSCAKEAPSLMTRGVSIKSDHPRYRISNLDELRKQLAQEAAANARSKAGMIADSSGVSILGLQGLEEKELRVMGKSPSQGWGPGNESMASPKGTVELRLKASYRFE